MSYENEKLMNLEDGRELLKVLDGKKANADSMFLYKSALPGSVVEVEDAVAECVKQMQIEIAPVQDLHGYGKPWVGGAGKNLLDLSQFSSGSKNNVTVTPTKNTEGALTSIVVSTNGSASALTTWSYTLNLTFDADVILSGGSSTASIDVNSGEYSDAGTGVTIPANTSITSFRVRIANGVSANVTLYPMIRLASDTDATFAPYSNICPISGHTGCEIVRTGKNLIEAIEQGTFSGQGVETDSTTRVRSSDYILVKEKEKYTVSGKTSASKTLQAAVTYFSDNAGTRRIDTSGWYNAPLTVETPIGTKYVKTLFRYSDDSTITVSQLSDIQLEMGNTVTEYEQFVGNNLYSITFPSPTPGTVYGGTLTLNQDGTGTLVVDVAKTIFDASSDENWKRTTGCFYGNMTSGYSRTSQYKMKTNMYESQGLVSGSTGISSHEYSIGLFNTDSSNRVYIVDNRFDNADDFKAFLSSNNVELVYELATAVSYTLTVDQVHLLLGYNALYASTGSILSMLYPTSQVEAVANAKADGILESLSTPSAVMSFSDGADGIPMGVEVAIEPVQDLHGYDKPWVGGAGKNLLDPTNHATIDGSVTWTMNDDGTISAGANSISSVQAYRLNITLEPGDYYFNGGVDQTHYVYVYDANTGTHAVKWDGTSLSEDHFGGNAFVQFKIISGHTYRINSCVAANATGNVVFKPMVCKSTETNITFEPYSNICPISGFDHAEVTRTGKNLCEEKLSGVYIDSNGVFTSGSQDYSSFIARVSKGKSYSIIKQETALVCGFFTTKPVAGVRSYNNSRTVQSNTSTFTAPIDGWVAVRSLYDDINVQIEVGSESTTYEPFVANDTYSITFPTSAGTVYGGTLTVNQDGTGTLAVDRLYGTLPNESTTYSDSSATGTGCFVSYVIVEDNTFIQDDTKPCVIFDTIKGVARNDRGQAWGGYTVTKGVTVFIPTGMTKAEADSILSGTNYCALLTNTIAYSLTPRQVKTLLGVNNIWADTGKINSVEYSADTKSYIDNLFSSITSAEGQTF